MTYFLRHRTVVEPYGVTLTSGDVWGSVDVEPPLPPDVEEPPRVAAQVSTILAAAEKHGMTRRLDVRLNNLEVPGDPSDMAKLKLTLDAPADPHRRVLLESDSSGLLRWHLAQSEPDDERPTFVVPVRQGEFVGRTGLVRHGVRKVLHVLSVAGDASSEYAARRWEERFRPYRLRWVDGSLRDAAAPADVDGAALVLVHGMFATCGGTFTGLTHGTLGALAERYGGRVLAFDHPTMADTPAENAEWLLRALPAGVRRVDLVCHSRGGLVGRELVARGLPVGTMVLVGTPNAGTPLADPARPTQLVNVVTNLIELDPASAAGMLDALVAAVEHLAVHTLDGLPGLTAMRPGNPWLAGLNATAIRPDGPVVHAVASDYEPTAVAGARMRAFDLIEDAIFAGAGNDLVVPMAGVASAGAFAIDRQLTFGPAEGVTHFGYFFQNRVRDLLLASLDPDPSIPVARGAAHVEPAEP